MHGSEDGVSSSTGQDVVGSSSADTSDTEDTTRLVQQINSQARTQSGSGVSQSHVEYLQVTLPHLCGLSVRSTIPIYASCIMPS